MTLKGKIAVITWGRRGIGKAISLRLASKGANVVVTDKDETEAINSSNEICSSGNLVEAIQVDVLNYEQSSEVVKKTSSHFGHVII